MKWPLRHRFFKQNYVPAVRNGAVLRELIYFTNKEVTNTRIAEAILKSYGMDIRFIYMSYPKRFKVTSENASE
jgi:hypothetical protein